MTCPNCITRGHRINEHASLGARLVELRRLQAELEKQARKTPPKTLIAERARVKAAAERLPAVAAEIAAAETRREELRAMLAAEGVGGVT